MTDHQWVKEYVDGGHVGGGDFFLCTTCGCSGGCADREHSVPHPFLPGPAVDLSEDCAVAHEQISYFILGALRHWRLSLLSQIEYDDPPRGWERQLRKGPRIKRDWHEAPGADKYILLTNTNKWTPKAVKRVGFHHLMFDWDRMTIEEMRTKLVEMGFIVTPRVCAGCGKDNDRPGDDRETLCYTCVWRAKNGT